VTVSIIGSGHIGSAIARRFAAAKMTVGIANRQSSDELSALVKELDPCVAQRPLPEALLADIVILAIPFDAVADAVGGVVWNNRIVVDATNPHAVADIHGSSSTNDVSELLDGARVVKAFNTLPAAVLSEDPAQPGGKRVLFVSSDDSDAAATVCDFIARLGFAPISLGALETGGVLQQRGGPLFLVRLLAES
jgi:8-hydroxy-5-deazaflavin:NADPH oxidoreductase